MKCPKCDSDVTVYRNPTPTVDIIIEIGEKIVLIERSNPPYGWALPGGYVDYGESFEDAALREAKEETSLDVLRLEQFRTYSDPSRDARHHTASTIFTGVAVGEPVAGDDAKAAALFDEASLPALAFDHGEIVADYYEFKKTGKRRR